MTIWQGYNIDRLSRLALLVNHKLPRNRQVACVEALDPTDAGAGIFGEGEDVHLASDKTSRMQIALWRKL